MMIFALWCGELHAVAAVQALPGTTTAMSTHGWRVPVVCPTVGLPQQAPLMSLWAAVRPWNSCNWNCNFPFVPLAPNTFHEGASWNCPKIVACMIWATLASNVRLHASCACCRLHWNALVTDEVNRSRSQCLTSKQQLITWLAANAPVRYVTTTLCKSLAKACAKPLSCSEHGVLAEQEMHYTCIYTNTCTSSPMYMYFSCVYMYIINTNINKERCTATSAHMYG